MNQPFHRRIRALAGLSIGRGCFFAALAIWCTMTGLISDPLLALKAGAILTMIVCVVLTMKGRLVQRASYKRTEVYILLDRKIEVTPEVAQRLITGVLRDTYNRYAFFAACLAVGFWILAWIFWLLHRSAAPV